MRINPSILFVLLLSVLPVSCKEKSKTGSDLLFYCAAGMQPPVEEIVQKYEEESGIRVNVQYGNSGTLLSNLRITGTGDLYLAGDESFIRIADDFKLLDERQHLAFLRPVIITAKNNPKKITSVRDFLRKDISYCIGTPETSSIGKQTQIILEKTDLWENIKKNARVFKPTVFDIANDVRLKAVDAGIVWDAVANQYPDLEIMQDELLNENTENVTVSVLKSSKNPKEALRFIRYLSASDKGLSIFQKFRYNVINGDIWQDNPELLLFIGAVNRVAVEEIIKQFEAREGVKVIRVYNGCGILVGQIKTGQHPDAFLTCDVRFMDEVRSEFTGIMNVSRTEIVIATKPGNPLQLKSPGDLNKKGLKIGICSPEQSALGVLTQVLFKELELEGINKNVVVQTPTADLLVNQIRTGALDAAIVYKANTVHVKDKIDIVPVEGNTAYAIQNIGIEINSKNKILMKRLIDAIKSKDSEKYFIENGFMIKN